MSASITDHQLFGFLQALATNVRGKSGLILTDWEQDFLNNFNRAQSQPRWFTEGRRPATDRMWRKYGAELNHPHPDDVAGPVNRISDQASPNGCEFWMKDEGRQRRCDVTAEFFGRRGLRYCRMHADEVIKNMRREGKSIELQPYQAK